VALAEPAVLAELAGPAELMAGWAAEWPVLEHPATASAPTRAAPSAAHLLVVLRSIPQLSYPTALAVWPLTEK